MKKKNKILKKIVAGIILMIFFPILVVGIISVMKSQTVLEENLKTNSIQTLKEVNNGFEQYLRVTETQLETLSKNQDIEELSNTSKDHAAALKYTQSLFLDSKESTEGTVDVFYGGEYGEFLNTDQIKTIDEFNFKERDWYKQAKEAKGKIIYTEPYKDAKTGGQVITVAKGIIDSYGNLCGVLGIDLSLDFTQNHIENLKLFDTGYVLVVDKQGNMVVNNKEFVGEMVGSEIWNLIKDEDNGVYKYKYNGKIFYACQQLNTTTNWKIVGIIDGNEVLNDVSTMKIGILVTGIISVLIGVTISIIAALKIVKEINKLNLSFSKVAQGDFTSKIDVTSNDEFGDLGNNFNFMVDNVSKLMKNVESTSGELIEASINISSMAEETTASVEEVSSAIQEVANGANSQAQSATNVALSVDDLSDIIDKVGNLTNNISKLSSETESLGNKGLKTVETLIEKTEKTKENSVEAANMVNEMAKSIESINFMSNSIASITEQTNLLSLNASIEAARAGDAGKGFAVVAEEIRKLAEESKKSTDEIKSIVGSINNTANTAKCAMDESAKMLEIQNEAVFSTKDIFNKIVRSIIELSEAIKNIYDDNKEMNKNKEGVKKQVENIAAVSEETASISEEVTASTEEVNATMDQLSEYANNLQKIASKLKDELGNFNL